MTYGELVIKRKQLDMVNYIATASGDFIYAVARNKQEMDPIVKATEKIKEHSTEYEKYIEELGVVNRKFALKEEDGTIAYVSYIDRILGPQRGFKKIVGEGNPESDYEIAIDKLNKKFSEAIKDQKVRDKKYEDYLKQEVPKNEYKSFMIKIDLIPDGLHPVGMEGCMHFINHK